MKAVVSEMRAHPAGQFALRIYARSAIAPRFHPRPFALQVEAYGLGPSSCFTTAPRLRMASSYQATIVSRGIIRDAIDRHILVEMNACLACGGEIDISIPVQVFRNELRSCPGCSVREMDSA